MASVIGSVPTFDQNTSTFEEWSEILEAWCLANDVEDAGKKRAVFLTSLGPMAYHTLRSLLQPDKPTDKTYAECKAKLQEHYSPKPSEIVLRYRFHVRVQKPGESIADFVAQLRHLSDGCNFGELDKSLRDRLVVGCQNAAIQRRLLSEKDLTFAKALATASAMEMAFQNVEDIKQLALTEKVTSSGVNKLYHSKERGGKHGKQRYYKPADETSRKCWRCGGRHEPHSCGFKSSQCYKCQRTGHTKSQCEAVKKFLKTRGKQHYLEEGTSEEESEGELSHLELADVGQVNRLTKAPPYEVRLLLNTKPVKMELDTGSPWSILSLESFQEISELDAIQETPVRLKTYSGSKVEIRGQAEVTVQHEAGQPGKKLTVLVVPRGINLLGRDWIEDIPLSLASYGHTTNEAPPERMGALEIQKDLEGVLEAHSQVFEDCEHGLLTACKARMYPIEDRRIFYKAAPVAYATKPKVDKHLDRMLEQGIIEPVRFSEYACPIVVADKSDGDIRICGNYKLTANKVLNLEQYPIPSLDDMVQTLQGGLKFSKVDLSHAYNQIELEDDSKKYTTINTHRGLYQYNRLPYGIASAPAWFQRTMETLLSGIPMCRPYLDDVIVSGRTEEEHLRNLEMLLQRLEENGMRLKRTKCEFMRDSITYLGHKIDATGIYPLDDKLEAVREAPEPQNQEELRAYLGLLGYYRQFIPRLTDHIAPLNDLLKAEYTSKPAGGGKQRRRSKNPRKRAPPDPKFKWGAKERQVFRASKELLQKGTLLVHYDPNKPLLLQTDASQYGLGAVISHEMPDGTERPIAFASRTMTDPEKNYAQYEKEALSIIFGLKKFHKYLHGRPFTIVTDHQPLVSLFGDQKPTSAMASARVTRWHMSLSGYQYTIVHKRGKDHLNADALSRLPVPAPEGEVAWLTEEMEEEEVSINLLTELDTRPVTAEDLQRSIQKDPILNRVRGFIQNGWPDKSQLDSDLQPYSTRRMELSVEDHIVMWGRRVIIPDDQAIRSQLLVELHANHPGIVKMKALARSYFWWPKLDGDLEQVVRTCRECQEHQRDAAQAPIHPWEFPPNPWQRIHIDYATVDGHEVLIGVDAHSKWIEATIMRSTTATATVKEMRRWFARYGLPQTVVSDNGAQFVAEEFYAFLTSNGIRHVQTAPYHPSSNGLAERAVQTVKGGVIKMNGDLETRLQKHLMRYRLTPQATTGCSPSELMMKRQIRSKFDQLRPDLAGKIKSKQAQIKKTKGQSDRRVRLHDQVSVKNFASGPTRLFGSVKSEIGPTMFEVLLEDGRTVRRHLDHIRRCDGVRPELVPSEVTNDLLFRQPVVEPYVDDQEKASATPLAEHQTPDRSPKTERNVVAVATPTPPARRESAREKRLPVTLRDYVLSK